LRKEKTPVRKPEPEERKSR
jgi:hypothetical protein